MKKSKKTLVRTDERIASESSRIHRLCFYILSGGMLVDLLAKFNLYTFNENAFVTVQLFLPEILLLCAVFYMNLFMLARRGIAFGAEWYDITAETKCPNRRYAAISAIVALVIAVGLWTPRFAFGYWEYGILSAILFCAALYLITFAIGFLVLFFSFRIAFGVAKRYALNEEIEETEEIED